MQYFLEHKTNNTIHNIIPGFSEKSLDTQFLKHLQINKMFSRFIQTGEKFQIPQRYFLFFIRTILKKITC